MGIFQGRSKGSWFGFVADAGQDMASLRDIERTTVATVGVAGVARRTTELFWVFWVSPNSEGK